MFMIDFAACLKTLKKFLKLIIPHPEDQEVSAKEDSQSTNTSSKFPSINFHYIHLICFVKNPGETWHIAIHTSLLDPIINWYHQILVHVGMTR